MPLFGGFFQSKADTNLQALFTSQGANIVECARELERFFADLRNSEPIMQHIVECEHEGDHITRQVHEALDRAFITSWLDKSDATELADHLDSFLDAIRSVARSVRLYDLLDGRKETAEFTAITVAVANLVEAMIHDLGVKDYSKIAEHHQKVTNLEKQADDLRDITIKRLWQETSADPRSFIAWKEIIEGLEKISDRGHHISQVILSICRKAQ
jgi:predicted phosphate transport protein (TIGR00153 family)